MILTREQIREGAKRTYTVGAPEVGGEIAFRIPSVKIALRIMAELDGEKTPGAEALVDIVIAVACDAAGAPAFEAADAAWMLNEIPSCVLMRVVKAASDAAGKIADPSEQAEKNSDPSPR